MICGVINGYYRTGSTIIWYIFNKDNLVLYEPHSESVVKMVKNRKLTEKTHNLPITEPYFRLPNKVVEKYLRSIRPQPIYINYNDAIYGIDVFDELDIPVFIQTNQLILVLEEFCEHYGCRYVHLFRDPAEVLWSHSLFFNRIKDKINKLLLKNIPNLAVWWFLKHGEYGMFYLRYCMNVAKRLGMLSNGDLVTKFLSMYINFNYYAYSVCSRGKFVRFEDIVMNPNILQKIAKYLRLKYDKERSKLLDRKKAFQAPERFKRFIYSKLTPDLKRKLEDIGGVVSKGGCISIKDYVH